MNCKNCNQEILETSKFCSNCGSNIEDVEQIVDVTNHNQSKEMDQNSLLNISKTQKSNLLNKKVVIIAIAFILIVSSTIIIYETFFQKETKLANSVEKENLELSNENSENQEELEQDKSPVTPQDAIEITKKVITFGNVEVVSENIIKGENLYYEVVNYTSSESSNYIVVVTLYVDKQTGEVYASNIYNPEKPWIKVEESISGIYDNEISHENEQTTTSETSLTHRDYLTKLMGSWTDNNEIRRYVKEGYYVTTGGLVMVEGEFVMISDKDEIAEILKHYKDEQTLNVLTKEYMPEIETKSENANNYMYHFEDFFTDEVLENAIIVSVENKIDREDYQLSNKRLYQELIVFTPGDDRHARVYELLTGANISLMSKGDFFKTTN